MKKKLFGLLLFSLILSSLAYAKIRETGNQGGTQNITEATILKLSNMFTQRNLPRCLLANSFQS